MTQPDSAATYVSNLNAVSSSPITVPSVMDFKFPSWNIAVGSNRSGPQYELRNLKSRSLTLRLNDEDTSTFSISGDADEALLIEELRDDVWWFRNGVLIHRGRILSSQDQTGQVYDVSYGSSSYEALLARRMLTIYPRNASKVAFTGSVFTVDDIIKWLISHAENQTEMRLGIKYGQWLKLPTFEQIWKTSSSSGDIFNLDDGSNIMDAIRSVCKLVEPDLDFWIDPFLQANLAQPRGKDQGQILDYGGVISDFGRSFNSDTFANVVWSTGKGTLKSFYAGGSMMGIPKNATLTNPSIGEINLTMPPAEFSDDLVGGWSDTRSDENLTTQPSVDALARSEWNRSSVKTYSYSATFAPGQWRGPQHIFLGDYVWFVAQRGRIDVREKMRIVSMTISIDENGVETVSVELNQSRDYDMALKNFRNVVKKIRKNL